MSIATIKATPIELERGETRVERFTAVDDTGAPVDLTGFDIWWTVRIVPGAGVALLHKSLVAGVSSGITLLNQTTSKGQYDVTIEHSDTSDPAEMTAGTKYYDTWARDVLLSYQPLVKPTPFILREAVTMSFV